MVEQFIQFYSDNIFIGNFMLAKGGYLFLDILDILG